MGNCICVILRSQKTPIRSNSGDHKSYAKVHPAPAFSPLPQQAKPTSTSTEPEPPVETLNPVQDPPTLEKMSTDNISRQRRTVKIVVTKKQFEELLKNVKELEATGTAVQFAESFLDKEKSPRCRWRPSLATIAE